MDTAHDLTTIALLIRHQNREHLPQLLALETRVNAGGSLTAHEINFLIDCTEAAHATLALHTTDQELNPLPERIIDLCDTIAIHADRNRQHTTSPAPQDHPPFQACTRTARLAKLT